MKLQVGKMYRLRNGWTVGPLELMNKGQPEVFTVDAIIGGAGVPIWIETGRWDSFSHDDDNKREFDIIAEVVDRSIYAVKFNDLWSICKKATPESYTGLRLSDEERETFAGRDIWATVSTTGFVCYVGQEERCVILEKEYIVCSG